MRFIKPINLNNKSFILDVRLPEERAVEELGLPHINQDLETLNPLEFIQQNNVKKDQTINILCSSGGRASQAAEMFEKAGFILEEFGDNTIKLIGVPNICMDLDTKELFMEILDAVDTVAITAIQEKEEKFIATIACKAAVKANMALSRQEVDALMEDLLKLPNPFTCPHGRPTAIKMSKTDIEKKFSRR